MKIVLAMSAVAGFASLASAGVGVETYGTGAPPSVVAGGPMTRAPFRADIFSDTLSTAIDAIGATATFSNSVSIRQIGFGWATWSHGYTGNVFYTNGSTSLTMTLSSSVYAFQFYGEPNPFGVFQMTATGSDGSTSLSSQQFPDGSAGATGWGFYGTGGAYIRSVTVSSDVDFAVGEFAATDVPAPGGLAALGLASLISARRRR